MSAPRLCECGSRVRILINPHRNPRSRRARRDRAVRLAGHDMCGRCWGALLTNALAKQRQLAAAFVASVVLAVLAAGCGSFDPANPMPTNPLLKASDTVAFDRGQVALLYADTKASYVLLAAGIAKACKTGGFDEETCTAAAKANERMVDIEAQLRKAIANPGVTVDWDAVARAVGIITDLALKVGAGL